MSEAVNVIDEGAVVEVEVEAPVCEICDGAGVVGEETCACIVAADNAKWGEIGHEIPGKFYQVYYGGRVLCDDEGLYDSFRANSDKVSSIAIEPVYSNYQFNKYGVAEKNEEVKVTITVNDDLKSSNPLATVAIDGKIYDLARLDTAVDFVMDKDHKISIYWSESLVESFRIVAKK